MRVAIPKRLVAYREPRWDDAGRLASEAENAVAAAGLDLSRLYALFRGRIEGIRAVPTPPNWVGVFVATTKG